MDKSSPSVCQVHGPSGAEEMLGNLFPVDFDQQFDLKITLTLHDAWQRLAHAMQRRARERRGHVCHGLGYCFNARSLVENDPRSNESPSCVFAPQGPIHDDSGHVSLRIWVPFCSLDDLIKYYTRKNTPRNHKGVPNWRKSGCPATPLTGRDSKLSLCDCWRHGCGLANRSSGALNYSLSSPDLNNIPPKQISSINIHTWSSVSHPMRSPAVLRCSQDPRSTLRFYCAATPLCTAPLSEAGDSDIQRIPPEKQLQLRRGTTPRLSIGKASRWWGLNQRCQWGTWKQRAGKSS